MEAAVDAETQIRIVHLKPMRVASVHSIGREPENTAWEMLQAWARPRGYLDHPAEHRIFGFNNPSPSEDGSEYGYELWMEVRADEPEAEEVDLKDFPGGSYAVLRWDGAGDPSTAIPAAWERLWNWRQQSPYHSGDHQWLEQHLLPQNDTDPALRLDLLLPIRI